MFYLIITLSMSTLRGHYPAHFSRAISSVALMGMSFVMISSSIAVRWLQFVSRSWFNDLPNIPSTSSGTNKPLKITVRGGSRLDSVALTLTSGTSYTHGGTGGTAKSLTLGTSEYWTSAKLCEGKYSDETRNFYILATTSSGNTLTTGKTTSDCSTFTAPTGWQIVGFFGQDGDEMDQLGFIYAQQ